MNGTLTDIPGLKVGHWTDLEAATGCTVILCPPGGAVAGVDVRGSAPGTRESQLLNPVAFVQKIHALLLTGGSAYGLAAADGVMRWLEEHDFGFDVGVAKVPIVPAAVIFDLSIGDPKVRPDAAAGYAACKCANDAPVAQGNVGAGTGATVGKVLGFNHATKSGLGSASRRLDSGLMIAALAVVNAYGEVVEQHTGTIVAGVRNPNGTGFAPAVPLMELVFGQTWQGLANTTLGVIATNAALTKAEATKIAQMGHDGLARVIRPIHTMFDGDTVFALAAGDHKADVNLIGAVGAEVLAEAVVNGVRAAEALAGVPAARDVPSPTGRGGGG
ncbi:MAG: P1 family peptidase [Anaerolineales bacterium]|nr:P1 family peptidase [Anaerolineales bacterium]